MNGQGVIEVDAPALPSLPWSAAWKVKQNYCQIMSWHDHAILWKQCASANSLTIWRRVQMVGARSFWQAQGVHQSPWSRWGIWSQREAFLEACVMVLVWFCQRMWNWVVLVYYHCDDKWTVTTKKFEQLSCFVQLDTCFRDRPRQGCGAIATFC